MSTPYYTDEHVTLYHGDAWAVLSSLEPGSVDCCVTSPPYFGLRDYGVEGQQGLEASPAEYVEGMRAVFAQVRRVLADDGTLWLNVGDSYASGATNNGGYSASSTLAGFTSPNTKGRAANDANAPRTLAPGVPAKNLLGIPWSVAKALQAPQYVGKIKSEADRAWLAGWLDGEGTITYTERDRGPDHTPTHDIKAFITNCDDAPLRHFAAICGGNVYLHDDGTRDNRYGKRPVYRWQMGTHDSALLIRELYPYLRTKKRQAALVWTMFTTLRHQNGHARTPAPVVAQRRELAQMVRALNAGEEVTLPSWVEEPPPTTEPGWILRNDIVWHKPNAMPESVTDRLSSRWEHVFLLSKSRRYHFDLDAIRQDRAWTHPPRETNKHVEQLGGRRYGGNALSMYATGEYQTDRKNPGDVWSIPTQPFADAHFACMPLALAERCVMAGCKPGGTVLDPYSGSGTTGLAATKHGCRYVGIDLNADYLDLSLRTRLAQATLPFPGEAS